MKALQQCKAFFLSVFRCYSGLACIFVIQLEQNLHKSYQITHLFFRQSE